tara:strand:- start:237 stop:527 length:291 start_codon:yes stop_codon:yes gene_type:complete
MPSAKQIKQQKAFAKKYAKKGKKKTGGKKTNPKKKNSSRAKLEQRLADLENKLNSVLQKAQGDYTEQAKIGERPEFQAGLKLRDELKRELESGRNG